MNERLISKYILSELIDSEEESYAIADGNQSIIWFNKGFKKIPVQSGLREFLFPI